MVYYIESHCDENGICDLDTTGCNPIPLDFVISVAGDQWTDSTCVQKIYDSNSLDMTCPNGSYIVDSITYSSLPMDVAPVVFMSGTGQIFFTPVPCSSTMSVSVYSRYICDIDNDGVPDTSNQQIDVINHIAPPIGDVRITKVNNTDNNRFSLFMIRLTGLK